MRKWLLFLVPAIALLAVYFFLYHKNKELKYIPEDADAVVLLDVKNLTRKYLAETISHPSVWFKDGEKKGKISWRNAGIKIPDFIQLFHLKNESFSNWYAVLEIKNKEELLLFLQDNSFQNKGNGYYSNGNVFLKINAENCIAGTSQKSLAAIETSLKSNSTLLNANEFITDEIGSLGIISGKSREKYSIHLNDDNIEISNSNAVKMAESVLSENMKQTGFISAQLDQKNIHRLSKLFQNSLFSDSKITSLNISVDLRQVSDTIISYDYDENFNEVEKISYQKIVQPQYLVQIKTKKPEEVWTSFEQKNWINQQNQFTAIPFLPNRISKNEKGILITSPAHPEITNDPAENFILVKNNPLLLSSFKSLPTKIVKKAGDLESVFYWNNKSQILLRFQFKSGGLPLILR